MDDSLRYRTAIRALLACVVLTVSSVSLPADMAVASDPSSTQTREFAADAHVAQLQKSAFRSLRESQSQLRRGAVRSAKMLALESLKSVVAMQDARRGGNDHTKQLENALNTFRELRDFSGQFGAVDSESLSRMVSVHETSVLKGQDVSRMTLITAAQAYLTEAQRNLVAATGISPIGSEALVVLGRVEREMAPAGDELAIAASVSFQQAAVSASPNNPIAHRELGVSLMYQGLPGPARIALQRSIQIQPTRVSYQRLMELSEQIGDSGTQTVCAEALRSNRFETEIPVTVMSPTHFAATHRPTTTAIATPRVASKEDREQRSTQTSSARKGIQKIFPFIR